MRIINVRMAVAVGSLVAITSMAKPPASAASAAANLAVSTTVTNNCTISTAPLAFGSYDPVAAHAAADLDGTGTVVVACTRGAAPTVGLGSGANANGGVRRMTDGSSHYLEYELYQDSSRSTGWTTSGSGVMSPVAAPSRAARNFTVYGRVRSNQDVPSGNYSDTVVATVNF